MSRRGKLTSKITNNVLGLAEVDLLCLGVSYSSRSVEPLVSTLTQQVAHLQLHILNHLANVGDMRSVVIHGHVLLHLPDHVSAQIERSKVIAIGAEVQDDSAGELVVGCAGTIESLEDVYAVPAAGSLAGWRNGYMAVSVHVRTN